MRYSYPAILNQITVDNILNQISNTINGQKEYQQISTSAQYSLYSHFLKLKYGL